MKTTVAIVLALLAPLALQAQSVYPTRALTFVVPFTAGSTSDISARAIAQKISGSLGQNVIVENRPGANG